MIMEETFRHFYIEDKYATERVMLTPGISCSTENLVDVLQKYPGFEIEDIDQDTITLYKECEPTEDERKKAEIAAASYKTSRYRQYLKLKEEFEPNAKA